MEQIWWERVPNALLFTSEIVDRLLGERSIILQCPGDFPWYYYMVRNIKEAVKQQNSSKRFECVSGVSEPGPYLLREFCKPEKRAEYRPAKTYARFFAESDDIVLHERYVWVKICSKEQLDSWIKFVSEYTKERGKDKNVAVFVLEWRESGSIQTKKGIKLCSFDEYVTEYDRIVFCTLASSSVKECSFMKNYLTELAANVVGNDIELCAACLESYKEFLQNPYRTIENILQSKIRSDGNEYSFHKTQADVSHLTWLAQIKTVYPVLEEYREELVQRYSAALARQLPITSSYGETYNDPGDVELGTLKYMADHRRLALTLKEYERLKVHREARNKLAHLVPLTLEEVKRLVI